MGEIFKIILSLSFSGTLLAIILLALRPFYKSRLRKSWQYYIWLIVLLRMVVPFAPETSLLSMLSSKTFGVVETGNNVQSGPVIEKTEIGAMNGTSDNVQEELANTADSIIDDSQTTASNSMISNLSIFLSGMFSNIWNSIADVFLSISIVLFVRKVVMYRRYTRLVKTKCIEVDANVMRILKETCEDMGIKRFVSIYENGFVNTPMLVGIVRPYIVLPVIHFTDDNYRMIFRHELNHLKRRDILYKWLVEVVICVHWFNPLVYIMRKEISKSCELSCDEKVLSKLDVSNRRGYGDVLMVLIQKGGKNHKSFLSVAMSEDGKNIKERLGGIIKYKKSTIHTRIVSCILTLVLVIGAIGVGAYSGKNVASASEFQVGDTFSNGIELFAVNDLVKKEEFSDSVQTREEIPKVIDYEYAMEQYGFWASPNPVKVSVGSKTFTSYATEAYRDDENYDMLFEDGNYIEHFFGNSLNAEYSRYFFHDSFYEVNYNFCIKLCSEYKYSSKRGHKVPIDGSDLITIWGVGESYDGIVEILNSDINFDSFEEWADYLNRELKEKGAIAVFLKEDAKYNDSELDFE
ncbi:M56 family metallopeptidase [Anaerosporobacter sp.]|uniref:M56 family metallopeptidase n=1 Tax=Anaerosporobacter sp. TaxID=1872529 RepID=UPI00286F3744|nr:M56 family metallopeptidase [Anaerosporobacter sp.]